MVAAIAAARRGKKVVLLEKNEKLGKKLYITGKGRCNVTNACDVEDLLGNVVSNPKFLYSSFYAFSNEAAMRFFEELGLPLKVERGNRVFPQSDKSSDVIRVLERELARWGVDVRLGHEVDELLCRDGVVGGVTAHGGRRGGHTATPSKRTWEAEAVILATGGLSYPSTGSTGDGYRLAAEAGHGVTKLSPSLVPMVVKEGFVKELQGLSLKNVTLRMVAGGKEIYRELGEMLFTHFGVSGPLVLSASAHAARYVARGEPVELHIDMKPGLSIEQLDGRIVRDFERYETAQIKNVLNKLLPKNMIPVIISLCGISADRRACDVTREEREGLRTRIKDLPLRASSLRGYAEAVVTRGGVCVKEVNPRTMESKKVKGLYFVGELLDVDAMTGGFNLQIAWSTGYAAGNSA